ncbi:MAG TPA: DUF3881 family protein [Blastocatellia bacterium]|nr:DUF3881 family protein [Blastocatellia bacterium]
MYDPEILNNALMSELFESVGFEVADEDSYNLLAEYTETSGERSQVHRSGATLHGRCWKVGAGLEVWSILYEREADYYYADCRPAFRSRYVHTVQPWELIEFDEDGEAIVRGGVSSQVEVIFELQNLTEINPAVFRDSHLHVAMAGLAYSAQVHPAPSVKPLNGFPALRFELAERLPELADTACENDYLICGKLLACRDLQNPVTSSELVWLYLDTGAIRLEVLVSQRALRGRPRIGALVSANIWLQGHVLEAREISARYEGVDRDYETGDFWGRLRRGN